MMQKQRFLIASLTIIVTLVQAKTDKQEGNYNYSLNPVEEKHVLRVIKQLIQSRNK